MGLKVEDLRLKTQSSGEVQGLWAIGLRALGLASGATLLSTNNPSLR